MTSFSDNELIPTIPCSTCLQWHHRPCVLDFEFTNQTFTCRNCRPPTSGDHYNSEAGEPYLALPYFTPEKNFELNRDISQGAPPVAITDYQQVWKIQYEELGRYLESYLASGTRVSSSFFDLIWHNCLRTSELTLQREIKVDKIDQWAMSRTIYGRLRWDYSAKEWKRWGPPSCNL